MCSKRSCPFGFTQSELQEIFDDKYQDFRKWMAGQTEMLCDGKEFIHNRNHDGKCGLFDGDRAHSEEDDYTWECNYSGGGHEQPSVCSENPHGIVTYVCDVERYILGLPVID